MANQENNQDLDLGEEKSGKKKLIIIIALVVLLFIGGGVAAFFLMSGDTESETGAADGGSEESEQTEATVEKGPAQYYDMAPVFVVNMPGKPSLLQVGVNLRITSEQMVEFLKHNDPMLRHHLLNLLQSKKAKDLLERPAKEALQTEMLDEINRIVKELSGPGEVDALYFTSFVMQ
ncbi:MAG: flagellar basal body-associated FliL family protein [Gammaproteobacteria bacterium]|nr:flagellar basal body-associated FliL family protein [Gammaproteobacteria bacterium]